MGIVENIKDFFRVVNYRVNVKNTYRDSHLDLDKRIKSHIRTKGAGDVSDFYVTLWGGGLKETDFMNFLEQIVEW